MIGTARKIAGRAHFVPIAEALAARKRANLEDPKLPPRTARTTSRLAKPQRD